MCVEVVVVAYVERSWWVVDVFVGVVGSSWLVRSVVLLVVVLWLVFVVVPVTTRLGACWRCVVSLLRPERAVAVVAVSSGG